MERQKVSIHILFVDDNAAFVKSLTRKIKNLLPTEIGNIEIVPASASCYREAEPMILSAAVSKQEEQKDTYDLILIDWKLKRLLSDLADTDSAGDDVVDSVKKNLGHVPYLLLTDWYHQSLPKGCWKKLPIEPLIAEIVRLIQEIVHKKNIV